MSLQRRISRSHNKYLIGQELALLVEGPSAETDLLWQGRLSTQAPEIDGICYINDFGPAEPRAGEMRTIRITEAHDYDLVGALVDEPSSYAATAASVVNPAANPFPILAARPVGSTLPAR
jgi:ribosomal protein S12 methylthiotransferase